MPADTDLIQLYSKRILALAADIPLTEPLETCDGSAKRRSPLCGSTVTACVGVKDGVISEFSQDVKACALGQASASVLGGAVIGKTRDDIAQAREGLRGMLKDGAEPPAGAFEALEVLSPAKDHKNRHASILLAWDATLDAIDQAAEAKAG